MTPPVKLTDMLEGLEWQADEGASYLHTTTEDVVSVTLQEGRAVEAEEPLEGVPAWQHDTMRIPLAVVAQLTRPRYPTSSKSIRTGRRQVALPG